MVRCSQCLIPLQKVKPKYLQSRAGLCLRQQPLPTRWCSEPAVPPAVCARELDLLGMGCCRLGSSLVLSGPTSPSHFAFSLQQASNCMCRCFSELGAIASQV